MLGGSSSIVGDAVSPNGYLCNNVNCHLVEERKDCVGFVSPYRSLNSRCSSLSSTIPTENVKLFDLCPSSSYVVFDSGYKYMFDKYNDVFRFVPLNGDIDGL